MSEWWAVLIPWARVAGVGLGLLALPLAAMEWGDTRRDGRRMRRRGPWNPAGPRALWLARELTLLGGLGVVIGVLLIVAADGISARIPVPADQGRVLINAVLLDGALVALLGLLWHSHRARRRILERWATDEC